MNGRPTTRWEERDMRAHSAGFAVAVLVGLLGSAAAAAAAPDPVDTVRGARDGDVRTAVVAPTSLQRSIVRAEGATAAWNQFGTPSSLVAARGVLASGVAGASARVAARHWLASRAALYKLSSTRGLHLVSDNWLAGTRAHAVTFRQVVGGLPAAGGGLVTVGLTRGASGWTVVSATSTLSGDESIAGRRRLSAARALQRAARNVGIHRSLGGIRRARRARGLAHGWQRFRFSGVPDVQRVRAVAFPLVRPGYVPAFETYVVKSAGATPR